MVKEIDAVEVVIQVLPADGFQHRLHQVPMLLTNRVGAVLDLFGAPELHLTACSRVGRVWQAPDRVRTVVSAENSSHLFGWSEVELHRKAVYVISRDASIARLNHVVVTGKLGRVEMQIFVEPSVGPGRCEGCHGDVAGFRPALIADRSIGVVEGLMSLVGEMASGGTIVISMETPVLRGAAASCSMRVRGSHAEESRIRDPKLESVMRGKDG